jgi:hypothetical protein
MARENEVTAKEFKKRMDKHFRRFSKEYKDLTRLPGEWWRDFREYLDKPPDAGDDGDG